VEADAVSLTYEGTPPPDAIAPHRRIGRPHRIPRDEPIATSDGYFDAASMDDQPSTPPTSHRSPTEPLRTGGPNPDECPRGEQNGLIGDPLLQRCLLTLTPPQQDKTDRNPCDHKDGDPGTCRHAVKRTAGSVPYRRLKGGYPGDSRPIACLVEQARASRGRAALPGVLRFRLAPGYWDRSARRGSASGVGVPPVPVR
jgi:hypothetical protein